jgi:CRISPR system Cascade subunit CasA
MSYSFNLLERPWIPCLTRQGTAVPLSLRETLARAHELLNITHESPLVGVSVMRLLLAVLHRVYGPRNAASWAILWRSPSFDMAALDGYFDEWRGRFDLFDAERPFYQDASIPRCLAGPVSKLVHSSASGNNATLFDHSLDDDCAAITAQEAASQLVAHQTYAVGGLATPDPFVPKSKYTEGSPTVKGILCMVRGDNLRQTLLLNLRRYHPAQEVPFEGKQDIPAWERVESAQVRERIPSGWLDLLTWQSRRILLFPEGDTVAPEVRNAAVMKGEAVSNSFALPEKDSMMAWQLAPNAQKGANPWIPLSFREERAVWRDAHTLFGKFEDQSVRPPILDWIGDLTDEVLDESHRYALDVAGLCTFQAKVLSWHAESLPLPLTILKQPALCAQVKKALEMAENGESALRSGTKRLADRLLTPQDRVGGEKKDSEKNAVSRLAGSLLRLQHYWAGLQIEFQKFIVDLAAGGRDSIDVETGLTEALAEWIRQCRHSAKRSMDLTFRAVGHGDRTFRAMADAESSFIGTLNQKLPDPEAKKEVVENDTAIAG